MKKLLLFLIAFLSFHIASAQCNPPTVLEASNITNNTATLSWTSSPEVMQWNIYVVPAGSPTPNQPTTLATMNPYVITGLSCGTGYSFYVQSVCDGVTESEMAGPFNFVTPCIPTGGVPEDITLCSDNDQACFNLTQNDALLIGTLNASDYTITYHTVQADAVADTNPILNPSTYCIVGGLSSTQLFVRFENNATGTADIYTFSIRIAQVNASSFTPNPMIQCDDDGDGIVTFDLTTVAAQLNTTNTLTYYTDSLDATSVYGDNPLTNPETFQLTTAAGNQTTTIFVRENIPNACDNVYSLQISAAANCNLANSCPTANSLCNSFGVPFSNTINMGNASGGIDYDCLFTQPNPTWFVLPISAAGQITLTIDQESALSGNGLDVDYICWGPFTNPALACNMLNSSTEVGCSYSTAYIETATIPNAQPGQYYILLVTNFSNQPGNITITQTSGSGEIDCSGIRMTAFLDSNSNGTMDSGELPFPLGQFNYELNNNGTIHNVTASQGVYNLYDMNTSNSYDFGFAIDPAYSANYSLTTNSYSNVSVIAGGGMLQYFFPVSVSQAYNDLAVTLVPMNTPVAGFQYVEKLHYTNQGSQSISGTVNFSNPLSAAITSVSQSGVAMGTNGFSYAFVNLQPFESRDMTITMQVPPIPDIALGAMLTSTASIEPVSGDINASNNTASLSQAVVGSYDPNEKIESHGGRILFSDFTSNDYLYYTIHFENTGTSPALNVNVTDVLDNKLDETSVRMIDASHDYVLDRTGKSLKWTFADIQLPASATNSAAAQGYVHFKVKPKAGYAVDDIIPNTASIFFDYNPAIVTNTFETRFVDLLATPSFSNGMFIMYPNPAGDHVTVSAQKSGMLQSVSIYDVLGKAVMYKTSTSNSETIDVSGISSGMYFLEATTSDGQKSTQKLIIK